MIRAGAAHAAAMAAIHAAAFPDDPWSADAFAILLGQPGVIGLLEMEPNGRAGMLLLRVAADEAEILTLGVTRPRHGLGRTLLGAAFAAARESGVTTLFLEVAADNLPARALYAGFGFAPAGTRPGYYPDGGDAVVLRLAL